jgi:hypothetical protein
MSLSFNDIQHKILEGTFELKLLPAVIHWQLQCNWSSSSNAMQNHDHADNQAQKG